MTTPPPQLPPRDPRGHKGTFGTVAVFGGCARRPGNEDEGPGRTMLGAPAFTALAALRAGCGLARIAMPDPLLASALTIAPGATGIPLALDHEGDILPHLAAIAIDEIIATSSAIIIGPGLGVSPGARASVLRFTTQDTIPIVLDADALNNLADVPELHLDFRAPAIITPHVGEFRRLAARAGITADPSGDTSRRAAAEELAQKLGCIVVLKSSTTIVSNGLQTWEHDRPNPALATAGSGDVLAGIMGALIAQHFKPPIHATGRPTISEQQQGGISLYEAARAAVLAHADAGMRWTATRSATGGLIIQELIHEIPAAVEALRTGKA